MVYHAQRTFSLIPINNIEPGERPPNEKPFFDQNVRIHNSKKFTNHFAYYLKKFVFVFSTQLS